jgi:small basic protein (TIGR04137 family)
MSIDRSLKIKGALTRHRNVLTRTERVEKLKDDQKWSEEDSVLGLPKVAHRKSHAGKKEKAAAKEAAATEAVAGAATEAAAATADKASPKAAATKTPAKSPAKTPAAEPKPKGKAKEG